MFSTNAKSAVLGTLALIALAAVILLASCSKTSESDTSDAAASPHRILKIGMELAYPPFEMEDPNGNPNGVSPDMARALAEYLHEPLLIEPIPFSGLIPALKTGKIDAVISSMTETPERAESIDFSDPYLSTGLCLLVKKSSPIQSIADADHPGITIVVKQGTTGQSYARDHIKNASVLVLDKETACVLEVTQGKADAFIYDQISTYENWRRNPDTTRPILKPFQEESWAIGLRKGDAALLRQVNAFLKDYKAKNGFEELGNRFLKDQKEAFRKLGYPFYF